ncbi:MAG: hypothetical protein PSW75_12780 [bacterium]|nr:hypothetical protein [bacterium]MDI1336238.1 hypothetical protein [Lacunisphaera sp.]
MMNDFTKFFLNEDWKALTNAPRFYLGAFGKHPGWNDHMDDLGLATASLVEARSYLYGGIAHHIEHATWEKAAAGKVIPGFDHLIHWRRLNESLTGLIWSSQDGKGRALYPMITVAHTVTRSFSWLAGELLPALEDVRAKCRSTNSASVVKAHIQGVEQSLRTRLPDKAWVSTTPGLGVPAWAAHFSKEPVALRRVLHHLRRNFTAFTPGALEWCQGEKQSLSRGLRLPQIPGTKPAESLNAWISFLATQLDPAVPFFGLLRLDGNWLDVIVGEPSPADFSILRASPAEVPMVTDIPYQLDAETSAQEAGLLANLGRGVLPEASCLNGQPAKANAETAAKWLLRFRPGSRPSFLSRLFKMDGS